ncbi:spore coat protein [Bacillus sp. 2205SS5-2]|uniref:spore coat protein n=1 Tax=Bacillus sp. 2205SS5-2 TaxID=3109031 RepID=UPI003007585B
MKSQSNQTNGSMHGNHEVYNLHEILSGLINIVDFLTIAREFVQLNELKILVNHQHQYILSHYHAIVTMLEQQQTTMINTKYERLNKGSVVFGETSAIPKFPVKEFAEINDEKFSGQMLGLMKSMSSLLTVSTLEIANPTFRTLLAQSVPDYIDMAYDLFLFQNQHNFYPVTVNIDTVQALVKNYSSIPSSQLK